MTKGRFWHVTGTLLLLVIILFAIPFALALLCGLMIDETTLSPLLGLSMAIVHAASAIAGLLFTLSLIAFYGQLRKDHFTMAARKATGK